MFFTSRSGNSGNGSNPVSSPSKTAVQLTGTKEHIEKLLQILKETQQQRNKLEIKLDDAWEWVLAHTNADGDTVKGSSKELESILEY